MAKSSSTTARIAASQPDTSTLLNRPQPFSWALAAMPTAPSGNRIRTTIVLMETRARLLSQRSGLPNVRCRRGKSNSASAKSTRTAAKTHRCIACSACKSFICRLHSFPFFQPLSSGGRQPFGPVVARVGHADGQQIAGHFINAQNRPTIAEFHVDRPGALRLADDHGSPVGFQAAKQHRYGFVADDHADAVRTGIDALRVGGFRKRPFTLKSIQGGSFLTGLHRQEESRAQSQDRCRVHETSPILLACIVGTKFSLPCRREIGTEVW